MRSFSIWTGGMLAAALVVLGLWVWHHSAEMATGAQSPYVAKWAVRSAGVAAIAAAQAIVLLVVIGRVYRRQLADDILRLFSVLVFTLALVSAIALGLAGH